MALDERAASLRFFLRDRYTQLVGSFDEIFTSMGLRILRSQPRALRTNSFAERWVGTTRRDCTDRLLIYNQRHLTHVLTGYVHHYSMPRPHRSLDQRPPLHDPAAASPTGPRTLHRERILGGLLNEYSYWSAA
ncbi:MAG: putative transposase [Actinomycetota bacterium]|nr:putative transposase [Actinomycetota bacterium]